MALQGSNNKEQQSIYSSCYRVELCCGVLNVLRTSSDVSAVN
jgi:hypothetical protein